MIALCIVLPGPYVLSAPQTQVAVLDEIGEDIVGFPQPSTSEACLLLQFSHSQPRPRQIMKGFPQQGPLISLRLQISCNMVIILGAPVFDFVLD